jgi:hypothetical protein
MKGWIGAILAVATVVIAVTIKPVSLFGVDSLELRLSFMAALLGAACVSFLLGQKTSELNLSRHVSMWLAGLAVVAVAANNLDLLGPKQKQLAEAKAEAEKVVKVPAVKKPRIAAEIYEPDTPKLERIERVIKRSAIYPLAQDDAPPPKKRFTSQEKPLTDDFKPSEEEKLAFKKFLKSQGLKYDPETAFAPPEPNEAEVN